MPRAWSCIAIGDDRQYGGNSGYDDELTSKYSFDSNVANHKQLSQGDLIIIRDHHRALGLAKVEAVANRVGTKLIRRCPLCRTTALKERVNKNPKWRCNKAHEFDEPLESEETVEKYVAHFGNTFVRLEKLITVAQLKGLALRPSDQLSIEELDLAGLERMAAPISEHASSLIVAAGFLEIPAPDEAYEDDFGADEEPSCADERERIMRAIKLRRGQSSFRRGLVRQYGSRCMVTGCELESLIETAHIAPYRNKTHNHLGNGLLLRADIHTLFDLYLMHIDPETLLVSFDENARRAGYGDYHGEKLRVGAMRPSTACLQFRANLISSRLL
jgi:putative restriction endonuclease